MPRKATTALAAVLFFGAVPVVLADANNQIDHHGLSAQVRSATLIPRARAQLDLTSGKFQGVQENVEQVMQLISAAPAARENGEAPSAALWTSSR